MKKERFALFTDKQEADAFAKEIEALCAGRPGPKIVKFVVWNEYLQRWTVKMEVEPDVLPAEIVDSAEAPVVEEGI